MTIRKLMRPRPFQEGADEIGVSSSPSGARGCGTPSVGPSGGHVSAPPPRRCRQNRCFIVTFRCPLLCYLVRRPFWRPFLRAPSKKVPTKAAFHRHLPVPATVRPRPQALLAAMSPRPFRRSSGRSTSLRTPESYFNEFTSGCTLFFNRLKISCL